MPKSRTKTKSDSIKTRTRLIINKDSSMTREQIPVRVEKHVMLGKKNKKIGVMRFLNNRAKSREQKRKFKTQRQKDLRFKRPFKHLKAGNSFYRFKRLETLVKNQHSTMKHYSLYKQRMNINKYNRTTIHKLRQQLQDIQVLLIVRIHRQKNLPRKLLSILHQFGLRQPFECCLLRLGNNSMENAGAGNTENTEKYHAEEKLRRCQLEMQLLKILPFITFGEPSEQLIQELLLKRAKINGERMKSNLLIERLFGDKFGLICVQDVVHLLTNPNYEKQKSNQAFDEIVSKFDAFQLNRIRIPIKGLTAPFDHKGYWGYRGDYINTFVEKLL